MKNNEVRFLIHLADNNIISSNELYNISYLNHTLNSSDKQIQEKDRFYKRVDVRVWIADTKEKWKGEFKAYSY